MAFQAEPQFNPMQLLPTLLSLAERQRAAQEEEDRYLEAGPARAAALALQREQIKAAQFRNRPDVQNLGLEVDQQQLEALKRQGTTFRQEQDFGNTLEDYQRNKDAVEGVVSGESLPSEPVTPVNALRQRMQEFDEQQKQMKENKFKLGGRYAKNLSGVIGDTGMRKFLNTEDTSENGLDALIKRGKDMTSLFKEEVGEDGKMYSISKVPAITRQLGLPDVIESEAIQGLVKRTSEQKNAALRYGFLNELNTGAYDPKKFEEALQTATGPLEREMLVRQTAKKLIETGQEGANPALIEQYRVLEAKEQREGRTRHTVVQTDSLGRQKARIVEVDDKGHQKTVWQDSGEGGLVTNQMRADAAKELGPLAATLKNVQDQKATLVPESKGAGGLINRYGGRFKAWLNQGYNPTAEELNALKNAMMADQYSLKQARYETGAQRSDQEIARIKEAYATGTYNYWEAKAALEIVEDGLNFAWDNTYNMANAGQLPKKPAPRDFGSAVNKKTPQKEAEDFLKRLGQ